MSSISPKGQGKRRQRGKLPPKRTRTRSFWRDGLPPTPSFCHTLRAPDPISLRIRRERQRTERWGLVVVALKVNKPTGLPVRGESSGYDLVDDEGLTVRFREDTDTEEIGHGISTRHFRPSESGS